MISMYVKREGSEWRSSAEEGKNFLERLEEQSCESQPLEIVLITEAPHTWMEPPCSASTMVAGET